MRTLVVVAIFMIPLLSFGIFGNLHLIYATAKCKQLQHRNGILVAAISFFDIISELHAARVAIEILATKSLMGRVDCYHRIFLYGYSFNMACVAVLFLAVDRLIAVRSPIKYRQTRSTLFIAIALTVGFIYSTPFVVIGFFVADDTPVEPCNLPASYPPLLRTIWTFCFVGIAILIFLVNAVNYSLMLRRRKKDELERHDVAHYQRQMQVTQSLLVMMVAYSMTTLLSSLILVLIRFLPFTKQTIIDITQFLSLLVLLNYGNNYYILFWRSQVYRKVFLKQLHLRRNSAINVTCTGAHSLRSETNQNHASFPNIINRIHNMLRPTRIAGTASEETKC